MDDNEQDKKKKVPPQEPDNRRNVIWGFLFFLPGSLVLALLLNFLWPHSGIGVLVFFGTPLAMIIPFVIRKSRPNLSRGMRYGFGVWFLIFIVLPFLGVTVLQGICSSIYIGN